VTKKDALKAEKRMCETEETEEL